MRVKIPNSNLREILIFENMLHFNDEEGFANADHLTNEEVERCRMFGFIVEGMKNISPKEKAKEEKTLEPTFQELKKETKEKVKEIPPSKSNKKGAK